MASACFLRQTASCEHLLVRGAPSAGALRALAPALQNWGMRGRETFPSCLSMRVYTISLCIDAPPHVIMRAGRPTSCAVRQTLHSSTFLQPAKKVELFGRPRIHPQVKSSRTRSLLRPFEGSATCCCMPKCLQVLRETGLCSDPCVKTRLGFFC